jgi:gamma-glutamylcyclotransferase (GGCT)/AIG2-like uncharacterized protein YtfP
VTLPKHDLAWRFAFYGSLRQSYRTLDDLKIRHLLRCLGPVQITGQLLDLGDFPGLIEGEQLVQAELHETNDARAVAVLDEYEGFDPTDPQHSLFVRRWSPLRGRDEFAWVYFLVRPPRILKPVHGGDWLAFHPVTSD